MRLLRFGITTGAAAAAAAKAAALALLRGERPGAVVVPTPIGLRVEVPVEAVEVTADGGEACASVRKFAGDNPDVLDGALVRACVRRLPGGGVAVRGGRGVGVVTRPVKGMEVGGPAISQAARAIIEAAVREVGDGLEVTVEVPEGEALAAGTMNPAVGIVGGVSILGTTGIEWPVSSEDYLGHIEAELEAIRRSSDAVALALGNTAVAYAEAAYGRDAVVKVGDRVGDALRIAARLGFRKAAVVSMPGKAAKLAAGLLNTHSEVGDARLEALVYAAVAAGLDCQAVRRAASAASVAEGLAALGDGAGAALAVMAARAKERLRRAAGSMELEVVIVDEAGRPLARA